MKLVSACLVGVNCAWHGGHHASENVLSKLGTGDAILVCTEQLGGLPTPRAPQEISGGTGEDVLEGRCRVLTDGGQDMTHELLSGVRETLRIAELMGATVFVAKSNSP